VRFFLRLERCGLVCFVGVARDSKNLGLRLDFVGFSIVLNMGLGGLCWADHFGDSLVVSFRGTHASCIEFTAARGGSQDHRSMS
jgi:hypothetical protein